MEMGWAQEPALVQAPVQEQLQALVKVPVASGYVQRGILPMHHVEVEVVEHLAAGSSANQSSCWQT